MTPSNADRTDYIQPAQGWVRTQLEEIDAAGGDASVVQIKGRAVVVVTMIGARSGRPRRVPVMRVQDAGRYAVVASKGGAARDPHWVNNLRTYPDRVSLLDGTAEKQMTCRELAGQERQIWWERAVQAYPPYADYQENTGREIPVFLLEPR